jgi:hypothetical protein
MAPFEYPAHGLGEAVMALLCGGFNASSTFSRAYPSIISSHANIFNVPMFILPPKALSKYCSAFINSPALNRLHNVRRMGRSIGGDCALRLLCEPERGVPSPKSNHFYIHASACRNYIICTMRNFPPFIKCHFRAPFAQLPAYCTFCMTIPPGERREKVTPDS